MGFTNIYPATFLNQSIPDIDILKTKEIIPLFSDEESVYVLRKITQKRIEKEVSYLDIISSYEQYFDFGVLGDSLQLTRHYIDLGLNSERTILRYMDYSNYRYDHIWGFEPNPSTFNTISEYFGRKKCGVDIIQKAVSNKVGNMRFNAQLGGSSHLDSHGDCLVLGTTLDHEMQYINYSAAFIKMDIEGEELNALFGAKNIIKQYRPILAVSVYHESNHLWNIPKLIKALLPDYKLYLRHYGAKYTETILYAL